MTLERFKKHSIDEKIEYMKSQKKNKKDLGLHTWQFSLAHALYHYNRSFVKNSAELSILFDDLKGFFVNV